ncbi:serine hydrolase [Filifactor villosus]|uniref:Serine hydrolase n=1 Tax=Filifactor villosus TaxID=29374 RepID=A0ABV9QK46_9FIRM
MRLETRIEKELVSYNGTMAFYARDFKGNTVAINEEETFETASTIKSFILLELFEQIKQGRLGLHEKISYEEKHRVDGSGVLHNMDSAFSMSIFNFATLMIIISDNTATNVLIDLLGKDEINATIQRYGFEDTKLHNRIDWERYDILGTTTAKDYGDFFYKLYRNELVDEVSCRAMIEIFKKQHYNSMITRLFPQYYLSGDDCIAEAAEQIEVASKSGSMNACRNDGGIVFTPVGDYVISMFHKDFHDPLYHMDHEASLYGSKASRMVLDSFLALGGSLV